MPKIILATAPEEFLTKEYLPPLGLLYIAACLEKGGYEVKVIDAYAQKLSLGALVEQIKKENPLAVGINATTHNRFNAQELIKRIKREVGCLVVAGGTHFSPTARDALEKIPELDAVVKGEGEITMKELLDSYIQEKSFSDILGLTFRNKQNVIIENSERPFIANLDDIPEPAWHLINLNHYDAHLEGEYKTKAIGVLSSRGCPNHCVFCANQSLWKCTFRKRSPKKFVDEVEFLAKEYGYRGFDFWDDTITVFKSHIEEICQEILKRKLDIIWYARARVNTVDYDTLALMRRAGCVCVSYGVESGSPRILKAIKKNITLDQVREIIKISVGLGMDTKAFFMFSLPSETLGDIKMTIDFMKELESAYGKKILNMVGYTMIYPATEIEETAKNEGLIPRDFSWNTYQEFAKARFIGSDATIPLYEPLGLPIEKIIPFVAKRYLGEMNFWHNAQQAIKRIHSWGDARRAMEMGINYYFRDRNL